MFEYQDRAIRGLYEDLAPAMRQSIPYVFLILQLEKGWFVWCGWTNIHMSYTRLNETNSNHHPLATLN